MRICIDDGSTNVKVAWMEGQKLNTLISPNSFVREWGFNLDGSPVANYRIEGEDFTYDHLSAEAIRTTEIYYQYSPVNVVAIHHALSQTNLEPQDIEVVVTLPLSEYLDNNNQPNTQNIERKKISVMRAVEPQIGKSFIIKKVIVLPESIPAGFEILKELDEMDVLLIVDLGGTTLNISLVGGKMSRIIKTWCDPKIGMSLMTEAIKNVIQHKVNIKYSSFAADQLIINRDDESYLANRFPDATHFALIKDVIKHSEQMLINRVVESVERFSGYTHGVCVGGGAKIVADSIKEATKLPKERYFYITDPRMAQVEGLISMKGE